MNSDKFFWQRLWHHPWVVAASNFALIMAIFSFSRLFFYWVNKDLYPGVSTSHLIEMMAGGVRFDLTALLYLNSVYLALTLLPFRFRQNSVYQQVTRWLYLIPNTLAIIVNCIDMVYIRFTDRRTTFAFFTEFENDGNIAQIVGTGMVQYWYVTLFGIAMIALLFWLHRRQVSTDDTRRAIVYYPTETVILCVTVYFVVIGIRGGFGAFTRPITLSNALQYTNRPGETAIVLNTPFAIMRSSESKTFPSYEYFAQDELPEIMSPWHEPKQGALMNKKNVVVLILESFSKEYFGYFNSGLDGGTYKGYTPFLDSLAAQSATYTLSLASGRKSIDAMPSVLSSLPMIISPYILTPYSTDEVMSIASCLKKKGYQTGFFHGAPNGSMGFLAYSRACGFEAYYGKTEYNNDKDYDGYWAIWDEEFLQYYAREMSQMQEPFMTALFTATSHHPFQVPKRYEGVFPEGTHPLHHCIGYSDHALQQFFAYAKTQPWYNNTLFVLTADHTNYLQHPEYTNDKGLYEVPIIFFDPQMADSIRENTTAHPVSQTDIMPSVLAYLNYDEPYFAFGQDALTQDKEVPYAINYNNPVYQVFSDSLLVQFDGKEITAVYNFAQDPLVKQNKKEALEQSEEVTTMLRYLKAYLQQYTNRLKTNRLTCP
ncbi:MAG: sulfatase-like hydrolase/transferase [Paludibacteraceae bacterium]|nr:sulfatase-like hydrolase/transferase [Paludibacteraceae bacterium]